MYVCSLSNACQQATSVRINALIVATCDVMFSSYILCDRDAHAVDMLHAFSRYAVVHDAVFCVSVCDVLVEEQQSACRSSNYM